MKSNLKLFKYSILLLIQHQPGLCYCYRTMSKNSSVYITYAQVRPPLQFIWSIALEAFSLYSGLRLPSIHLISFVFCISHYEYENEISEYLDFTGTNETSLLLFCSSLAISSFSPSYQAARIFKFFESERGTSHFKLHFLKLLYAFQE